MDTNHERERLKEELYQRYATSQNFHFRMLYYRKKYFWLVVVGLCKFFKRTFDILASGFLLIVLSPLLLLIAIIIKLTDGGPVFYISTRVGKWGKEFAFPKFRSMRPNADQIKEQLKDYNQHKEGVTFKIKGDPRITWFGKYLRKFSLDELPQLWCVIKGDMSLVGPRPPLPEEVALYRMKDRARLDVTPGLTCIWQVSGRSDIAFTQQVELDRQYIESQSLLLDIYLLLKTIPVVILGKGAY